MAKISPFKFLQEVRVEAQKVTWPSRRETAVTTAMVFVMVAIAAVFFLLADQVMRMFVTFILGIGGGKKRRKVRQTLVQPPPPYQFRAQNCGCARCAGPSARALPGLRGSDSEHPGR